MSDVIAGAGSTVVPHHHFDFKAMVDVQQSAVGLLCRTRKEENPAKFNDGLIRLARSRVSGETLFEMYLDSFPTPEERQYHNCACCRAFMKNYGNLLFLLPDGQTSSLFFSVEEDAPIEIRDFIQSAWAKLFNSPVEQMFFSKERRPFSVGTLEAGGFNHFHFTLENILPRPNRAYTVRQNAAIVDEDIRLLTQSFAMWEDAVITHAIQLFEHHKALANSQFADIVSDWLDIRTQFRSLKNPDIRRNYLYATATTARKGVLRIGQSVVGQFLTDLGDMGAETAISLLASRTTGVNYQRPKAAPTSGAVAKAERLFVELNLGDSLKRRSLRRDELPVAFWRKPAVQEKVGDGIFSHLQTKDSQEKVSKEIPDIDGGRISYESLLSKIPDATKIEIMLGPQTASLSSMVTEEIPNSTPILRWDSEEQRNPVSTYRYANAVHPSTWGLSPRHWHEVTDIVPNPTFWYNEPEKCDNLFFVFAEGCDRGGLTQLPLFPETLRNELHEVRAVIEEYCKTAKLSATEDGFVCWNYSPYEMPLIRITKADSSVVYSIASLK